MTTPSGDRERILARAKGYPYVAPRTSFVLTGGRVHELPAGRAADEIAVDDPGAAALDPEGMSVRVPVLAYGANRSAEALERKRSLSGFPAHAAIVALCARASNLDVVYSAHLTPYGSVGATLARSPGTIAEASVLLLTPEQLTAFDETEPNYTLEELDRASVALEAGGRVDGVRAYVSRHGCLALDGEAAALAAIPARAHCLRELTEPEVLALVAARLGHHGELDNFILETAGDPAIAAQRTRSLRRDALSLDPPVRPPASGRAGG